MFSTFDCLLVHIRQKEDHINPIVSGFVTGGLLAIRGIDTFWDLLFNFIKAGPRPAFRNALVGGLILGFIEMAQIVMIKWQRKSDLEGYNAMMEAEISKEKLRRQKEMDKYREGKKKKVCF